MDQAAFGRLLVSRGVITPEQLQMLLQADRPVAELVVERGLATAEQVAEALETTASLRATGRLAEKSVPEEARRASADPANRFGKYVVLDRIGKGGMGVVHRAWDLDLNRPVALKFLTATDEEEIQRFLREARTAASLSHPNIVSIFEVGEIGGRHYISMEYLSGRTLDKAAVDPRRAASIARDVAVALQYAHSHRIVHRDIKPQNIMVTDSGRICVMDFGLARQIKGDSTLTQTGVIVGTPSFMSPEQTSGVAGKIDHRADVYALGATLYATVTGRLPFSGQTALEIVRKVAEEDPVPPRRCAPGVDRNLENIILKAMSKDPSRRYPTARDMGEDLGRYTRGEPVLARPVSLPTQMILKVRRNPLGAIAVASIAVLALGLAAWTAQAWRGRAEFERLVSQGDAAFRQGGYREALQAYSRAQQLRPKDPRVRERVDECRVRIDEVENRAARAADRERRMAEARPRYELGVRTLEDAVKDLYRPLVTLDRMRARLSEAVDHLDEAIAIFPEYQEAYLARGRARVYVLDDRSADKDLSRAVELGPDLAGAYVERGRLALRQYLEARLDLGWIWDAEVERPFAPLRKRAEADFRRAVDLGDREMVHYHTALRLFAEGRIAEGLEECARAVKKSPTDEEVHKLQGDLLSFAVGREEAAISRYSEAIALRPNYYEALIMRANQYSLLGRWEEVRADVERALLHRAGDPLACWLMAKFEFEKGRRQEALKWHELGLKRRPESFVNRIGRAACWAQEGQVDRATAELNRLVQVNPAHYFVWYLRGSVRSKGRDEDGAIEDLKKSATLHPKFSSTWFNLGVIHFNKGQWDAAEDGFLRALELGHPQAGQIREILRQVERRRQGD
jgi:serine/threonine-protein kinase